MHTHQLQHQHDLTGRVGASVVDLALMREVVYARRRDDPLAVLSSRERTVLG